MRQTITTAAADLVSNESHGFGHSFDPDEKGLGHAAGLALEDAADLKRPRTPPPRPSTRTPPALPTIRWGSTSARWAPSRC